MKYKLTIRIFVALAILAVIAGVGFLTRQSVSAGASDNVSGWAWSDTVGWMSFNCSNTASCGSVNYGVHIDQTTGNMTGWAWSDNVGWIKFGGLSGFPTGSGSTAQNAQLVSGSLRGWARACAGTSSGNCSSMTSRTDGWDGWISLNGTSYGLNVNTANSSGFAWGSDVVGWTDFSLLSYAQTLNPNVDLKINGVDGPVGVTEGSSVVLNWQSADIDTATCALSEGGSMILSSAGGMGSTVRSSLVSGTHTYTYSCQKIGTTATVSDVATVNVTSAPGPGPGPGPGPENEPDMTCWAEPSSVGVNKPMHWKAKVTDAASGADITSNYTLEWSGAVSGTGADVVATYSTKGKKNATVTITDTGVTTPPCDASLTVRAQPVIIEF